MSSNLIWILYRSDSDTAYKETLNCKKIIEGYGKKVLFIATAERSDEEMEQRINEHIKNRPNSWETVESPLNISE